jgi:branched-subunit amino acid aminotransferase/4-amino-4-deoxychorismate lyase
MNHNNFCYFNGDLVRYQDLQLHVSDLLFQRGYGIFDFFRCRNGNILWLEDYMDRLFNSLRIAGIEINLDRTQFEAVVNELQEKNGISNGAFKVIVSGGYSDNLESVSGAANFMILNLHWNRPPEAGFEKGVNLIRDEYVRPNPEVKSLFYLNRLKLRNKLREYRAVDVLYHSDTISEASRANLFFVKGGQVFTPVSNILKGITRKQVLSLFGEIRVRDIEADRLYDFDELFLTSTTQDVTPVVSVEGIKIGKGVPGPVTKEIQAAFRAKGW